MEILVYIFVILNFKTWCSETETDRAVEWSRQFLKSVENTYIYNNK